MIEMLSEKSDVVARKPHGCDLCGLSIPKGSTHYTQRNADGSSIWTWRAHPDCYSQINAYWAWCGIELRDVDKDDDIPHDEFRQFLASTSDNAGSHGLTVDGDPASGEHWSVCDCGWRSGRMPNTDAAIDAHSRHIANLDGES